MPATCLGGGSSVAEDSPHATGVCFADLHFAVKFAISCGSFCGSVWQKWRNETGLPQGGAPSVGLFGLLTVLPFDRLVGAEVGLPSEYGLGPALCYVDDVAVALLLKNSFAAQSALDLTASWACDLRLKLNVGDDKTASLRGPSGCPGPTPLSVDGVPLPWATAYRYLGGLLHCAGSVRPMLQDCELRLTKRTGVFVSWGPDPLGAGPFAASFHFPFGHASLVRWARPVWR